MSITTAMPTSFKQGLFQAQHNFNASGTATGTLATNSTHVTSVSSMANIARGCLVTGTGVPANAYVGEIDSSTSFYMTQQATGSGAQTLTFSGDDFRVILVIASTTGTIGAGSVQYGSGTGSPSSTNIGTDELATGSGYTQGGYDITAANNITPTTSGTTAYTTPNVNPSWTSATFSTSGCVMYNNSNQTYIAYVGSFGGTQTVTSGTFTILMPTNNSTNALLRIS